MILPAVKDNTVSNERWDVAFHRPMFVQKHIQTNDKVNNKVSNNTSSASGNHQSPVDSPHIVTIVRKLSCQEVTVNAEDNCRWYCAYSDILVYCHHKLLAKSHEAPVPYLTMHHLVTEMCTCVHISVTKWGIVGFTRCVYANNTKWLRLVWIVRKIQDTS